MNKKPILAEFGYVVAVRKEFALGSVTVHNNFGDALWKLKELERTCSQLRGELGIFEAYLVVTNREAKDPRAGATGEKEQEEV